MKDMPEDAEVRHDEKMPAQDSSVMAMPSYGQLHVVVHGLIGVRLSYQTRTVQLHFPSNAMHVYHAGSFDDLKELPYGHDYKLGGVRAGSWTPKSAKLKNNHLVFGLAEHGNLSCSPRSTHATVTLPWPDDVGGVRAMDAAGAPDPLFEAPDGVNPRNLHYITYLTYQVERRAHSHPILRWNCCHEFWRQEELHRHMRLHFFADPISSLSASQWPDHMSDAYVRFNDQLFGGALSIAPDTDSGPWHFADCTPAEAEIVPKAEAIDFGQIGHPDMPPILDAKGAAPAGFPLRGAGEGGNCLSALILD